MIQQNTYTELLDREAGKREIYSSDDLVEM